MFVGDDFQLDPVRFQRLPRQFRRHDRVPGREAAGGVGQDPDVVVHQELEQRACFGRRVAAHGHGGQLRAGSDQRRPQPVQAGCTAGAHDQPRPQRNAVHDEGVRRLLCLCRAGNRSSCHDAQPPCTAVTSSTSSPSASAVTYHWLRGTTSEFRATATPSFWPSAACPLGARFRPVTWLTRVVTDAPSSHRVDRAVEFDVHAVSLFGSIVTVVADGAGRSGEPVGPERRPARVRVAVHQLAGRWQRPRASAGRRDGRIRWQ